MSPGAHRSPPPPTSALSAPCRPRLAVLLAVLLAQSFDLIHWTPLDIYFDIDQRYYNLPGRWDCIYTIPTPQAFSTPAHGAAGGCMTRSPRCRVDAV